MTSLAMERNELKSPLWLKITAGIGVIWYAFGLLQFWLGYTMDTQSAVSSGVITAPHAAAIAGTPLLIWLAFALASATGLIGSLYLMRKSAAAKIAFGLSVLSAATYFGWIYLISGTGADRPAEELIIAAVVGTVTLAFFLLSRRVT